MDIKKNVETYSALLASGREYFRVRREWVSQRLSQLEKTLLDPLRPVSILDQLAMGVGVYKISKLRDQGATEEEIKEAIEAFGADYRALKALRD